jgi:hypothetical protein
MNGSGEVNNLSILPPFRLHFVFLPVPFSPSLSFRYIHSICARLCLSRHSTFCTFFHPIPVFSLLVPTSKSLLDCFSPSTLRNFLSYFLLYLNSLIFFFVAFPLSPLLAYQVPCGWLVFSSLFPYVVRRGCGVLSPATHAHLLFSFLLYGRHNTNRIQHHGRPIRPGFEPCRPRGGVGRVSLFLPPPYRQLLKDIHTHPWPGGGSFLGKNPPPSVRFEPTIAGTATSEHCLRQLYGHRPSFGFFDYYPSFLLVCFFVPFTQLYIQPSSFCSQSFHFFTGIPVSLTAFLSLLLFRVFFFSPTLFPSIHFVFCLQTLPLSFPLSLSAYSSYTLPSHVTSRIFFLHFLYLLLFLPSPDLCPVHQYILYCVLQHQHSPEITSPLSLS